MKDYGADVVCPNCGTAHHMSPRQLQTELQITFTCTACGHVVVHDNAVALRIADEMHAIKGGLGKIKI